MKPIELIGFSATIKQLLKDNKRDVAHSLLDHFFDKARTLAEFDAIGQLCMDTEHRELYFRCAKTAYAVAFTTEQKVAARTNLIRACNVMNQPERALQLIDLQLQVQPDDFSILCERAGNLSLLGRKDEAENLIDDLLAKYPDKRHTLYPMLSGRFLRQGQVTAGIRAFVEGYKAKSELFDVNLKMKRWDGVARAGKTLYVEGEGGIGDEIINIRFFENVKRLGMKPVLVSPSNVFHDDKNALFRRHGIEIVSDSYSIDQKQVWTPFMSLPADLNLTEETLWTKPYLTPLRKEENRLVSDKLKIGIKCSGNPYFAQDEYRKIPYDQLLAALPKDAQLYYIDKTDGHHSAVNLAPRINSWEDTLDFIDQMDCIVSSCTSLVHAAGAMGKPTFVAVPIAEYYIWTSSRTDNTTPWYGPHLKVFKQQTVRSWVEPLEQIKQHVAAFKQEHQK